MKISKARGLNEDEGEDVALVTMASELKTGIVVWLTPCGQCGGHHRMMLGNPTSARRDDGVTVSGYRAQPVPSCVDWPGISALVYWATDGPDLYRVVDPLLEQRTSRRSAEFAR
jgi:hypothetical protein